MFDTLRRWAQRLKRQALVVYFVARDPRTPWVVRLLAMLVAAYAFSPVDLIPDFIPVLGYLDDLVLVPLGVALVLRLAPTPVMADAQARAAIQAERPASRPMAVAIIGVWIGLIALALWWGSRTWQGRVP